ncbi:MAG: hypothetical protein ABI240_02170 [Sphingomonas sp.]
MSDPMDLTGVWYGEWTAQRPVYPNSFIAHLVEAHGLLSGSITEPDIYRRPAIFRAFVEGARAGADIRFIKQYDGSGRMSHAVLYTGRINRTATEITGTWHFSAHAGSFTMRRESFTTEELEEREEISEPI